MAFASAGRGASATSSHDGKRVLRSAYARSRLVSLVCCERTVRMSSSSGGRRRGAGGAPYTLRSRSAMARRRRRTQRVSAHPRDQLGLVTTPAPKRWRVLVAGRSNQGLKVATIEATSAVVTGRLVFAAV